MTVRDDETTTKFSVDNWDDATVVTGPREGYLLSWAAEAGMTYYSLAFMQQLEAAIVLDRSEA